MKKGIALFLAISVLASTLLVACSNDDAITNAKKPNEKTTAAKNGDASDGLDENEDLYELDYVDVTDSDGKKVTDKNGDVVTTEVAYKVETDADGNSYGIQLDEKGEAVTDKKGNDVTVKVTKLSTTKAETTNIPSTTKKDKTTVVTKPAQSTTKAELTTIEASKDKVPTLSASGSQVKFSQDDADTVARMLMVPYLYNNNYENKDGVPTNIAAHAAMWMASQEGLNTSVFASGTIVLDLFKFFGQTVVNFKSNCNNDKNKDYAIKYNVSNDTFTINQFESSTHKVSNLSFYSLGNNNYYKVTGSVSGCKYTKVTAIIQRNKLDSNLGFSIKALKWS